MRTGGVTNEQSRHANATVFSCANLWGQALIDAQSAWDGKEEPRKPSDQRLREEMKDFLLNGAKNPSRQIMIKYNIQAIHKGLDEAFGDFFREHELKEGLKCRALQLERLAVDLAQQNASWNAHRSASTKLAWFASPTDWTMFDSLAYAGLFYGERAYPGRGRMISFYDRLEEWNFLPWLSKVRKVLAKQPIFTVPAERVADKALMIMGRTNNYARLKEFSDNRDLYNERQLAAEIERQVSDYDFTRRLMSKWRLE